MLGGFRKESAHFPLSKHRYKKKRYPTTKPGIAPFSITNNSRRVLRHVYKDAK